MPTLPAENKHWDYALEMDYYVKLIMWRLWQKHHPAISRADMSEVLGMDRAGVTRRFKAYDRHSRKGYLFNLIDLFAFCRVLEISPTEVITEAMMEYEVRKRTGQLHAADELEEIKPQ